MNITIVGAGPAGIFASLELADGNEVTVYESKSYIGGAGLHSDGKLNFSPTIGGNLLDFVDLHEAERVIGRVKDIFSQFGIQSFPSNYPKELNRAAISAGLKFINIDQAHIGSDYLPSIMEKIKQHAESKGIRFVTNETISDFLIEPRLMLVSQQDKEIIIHYPDKILFAPGRNGNEWLAGRLSRFGVKATWNPIDIGVRVETSADVMEPVTTGCWDAKIHIRTSKYDDFVRTFCTCPYGYVVLETYGNQMFGVNGYSLRDKKSPNTNFALLVRVNLTQPLENSNMYGSHIVHLTNTLGGNKPIIQRLGDIRNHRRTTIDRLKNSSVEPTLSEYTPGDISMAYPKRIMEDILESIGRLNAIAPGIDTDSTLIYAPEVKFYSLKIETDKLLRTSIPNISVAGDGAGVSRGIVGAAATGIIAAIGMKG